MPAIAGIATVTGATGTTLATTMPDGVTAGDQLLLIAGFNNAAPTPGAGWDQTTLATGTGMRVAAWTRTALGGDTAPTLTGFTTNQPRAATILRIVGHDGHDVSASVTSTGTPRQPPTVTTTTPNALLLHAVYSQTTATSTNNSWSGAFEIGDARSPASSGTYAEHTIAWRNQADAGTAAAVTVTHDGAGSATWAALTVAIKYGTKGNDPSGGAVTPPDGTVLTAEEVRKIILERQRIEKIQQRSRPGMHLADKNWENRRQVWGEIDPQFEEKLNETGEGSFSLFGTHHEKDYLLKTSEAEDIHVYVNSPGLRWAGKVNTIEYADETPGLPTIKISLMHDYEHMKKVVCYSNPIFPAEFQYPKIFMYAGPSISGIKAILFLNLLRRFGPLWTLPENLFSPQSWLENLNPLNWPIIVDPRSNFLSDTSQWTVLTTRFGNFHDVVQNTLKDAGLQIVTTRWLPGDPQPFPAWATLTKPTLIVDVVDKSGVRGPTGTALDGLFKLASHIASDGITEIVDSLDWGASPQEYDQPTFFGTVKDYPWVSFHNGMRTGLSGISKWRMTIHKPLAGAVVTGGRSPAWVNTGIKLLLNAALGYLGSLIGNPGLAIGIFEDQVEDVILAFHRVTHIVRQTAMGRGQYGEHWENTNGTGFSVSALQAIRIGLYKTRAYTSFSFEIVNGAPYWIGRHFQLGDRISGEVGDTANGVGQLYVDQTDTHLLSWGRDADPNHKIGLGDNSAEREPSSLLAHQLENVRALVQGLGVDS